MAQKQDFDQPGDMAFTIAEIEELHNEVYDLYMEAARAIRWDPRAYTTRNAKIANLMVEKVLYMTHKQMHESARDSVQYS